ncbi:MAG: glycosyltransferase family 39 protein, partial [Chloroflexota bacterium]|nr:glycosyltransferase family 39 protein [Chloroflexota bacterium]
LLAVYMGGKRLYGKRVATVAVAVTALSVPFVFASHLGRHDIVVTALGYWAFVLCLYGDPNRVPYRSFLAGLAIGLTLDIHPNGIVFAPAIALFYLNEHGWRFVKTLRFWAYVLGGAVGLLWFVALHILPYPNSYFALFSLGNGAGRTPPASDPLGFVTSVAQTIWLLGPVPTLLCLAGLAVLLYRRSASDSRLAAFFVALVLAYAAVVRGKPVFYEVLIVPAYGLVVAALLRKLWTLDWPAARLKATVNAAAWVLAATPALLTLSWMLATGPSDFDMLLQKIRAAVPLSASVMGTQTYYFALPDQRYLSWEQLVYYRRDTPGSTLEDALRAMHPDYLIFDSNLNDALSDKDATARSFLSLPRSEFDAFVKKYTTVTTLHSQTSGDVLLYRIDWSK